MVIYPKSSTFLRCPTMVFESGLACFVEKRKENILNLQCLSGNPINTLNRRIPVPNKMYTVMKDLTSSNRLATVLQLYGTVQNVIDTLDQCLTC